MNVFAFLRHPALLLVAVSAAIALGWFVLGRAVEMPRSPFGASEKLHCVSYDPLSPEAVERGEVLSPERIDADLARLAPLTSCIRTYRTGAGLDHLPDIAARHGLWVWQGIAIGRNAARNDDEIERAIALAPTHRDVIRAFIVGSEVLSRRDLPSIELLAVLKRVRGWTGIPVSYADRWNIWLEAESIAAAVDFITVHIDLYRAEFPVPASEATREMVGGRARVAVRFKDKKVVVGEAGWPSAGRMREAALPSPASQARVLHEFATAAKAGDFELNLFEGYDQPWRQNREGVTGSHWGLLDADTGAQKFVWGRPVSNHPLWFTQGSLGVMLAFVVFAAAYAAARSFGLPGPRAANWWPVALIALAAGLPIGWAVAEIPLQTLSVLDWLYSLISIGLAFAVPPVAAAALVLRTPVEGFAIPLNARFRQAVGPLGLGIAVAFVLTVLLSMQQALGLVFDPAYRSFPFAPLTGPVVALLVLTLRNPAGSPHGGVGETVAAVVLAAAALFIAVNETLWNWQALWFAALLLALAWTCRSARTGQIPR
jgi:exo-beta-1,3-glucanase (GH17 family)